MPSSHAASVAALSTTVGIEEGVLSTLFGVTLFFSLIVMYDAAGLRRAAGHQATPAQPDRGRATRTARCRSTSCSRALGHTPLEVLVGAAARRRRGRRLEPVLLMPRSAMSLLAAHRFARRPQALSLDAAAEPSRRRCASCSSRRSRRTGGHLAPCLGVVELTLALHHVFDTPARPASSGTSATRPTATRSSPAGATASTRSARSAASRASRAATRARTTRSAPPTRSTSISAALGMAAARDLRGRRLQASSR